MPYKLVRHRVPFRILAVKNFFAILAKSYSIKAEVIAMSIFRFKEGTDGEIQVFDSFSDKKVKNENLKNFLKIFASVIWKEDEAKDSRLFLGDTR